MGFRRESGFSLLEVLLGLVLAAVVMATVYSAMYTVVEVERLLRRWGDQDRELEGLFRQMRLELKALVSYRSWARSLLGVGGKGDLRRDRIAFITSHVPLFFGVANLGRVHEVAYFLQEGEDGSWWLCRREGGVDFDLRGGGVGRRLVRGVEELALDYFDGVEWRREWVELGLPRVVRIRLGVRGEGGERRWYGMEVLLLLEGG